MARASSEKKKRETEAVLHSIRSEFKEYKYLCKAIEYETNPVVVSNKLGIESRINSFKNDIQVGPITKKG